MPFFLLGYRKKDGIALLAKLCRLIKGTRSRFQTFTTT